MVNDNNDKWDSVAPIVLENQKYCSGSGILNCTNIESAKMYSVGGKRKH